MIAERHCSVQYFRDSDLIGCVGVCTTVRGERLVRALQRVIWVVFDQGMLPKRSRSVAMSGRLSNSVLVRYLSVLIDIAWLHDNSYRRLALAWLHVCTRDRCNECLCVSPQLVCGRSPRLHVSGGPGVESKQHRRL